MFPQDLRKFLMTAALISFMSVISLPSCTTDPTDKPQTNDTTSPTVFLSSLNAGASSCSVTVSYEDDTGVVGVELSLLSVSFTTNVSYTPSSPEQTGSHTFVVTLPTGSYTVAATARDAASNIGTSATSNITISSNDTTAPTVTILSPSNGQTVGLSVNLVVSLSDNGILSGVWYQLNGSNWSNISLQTSSTNLTISLALKESSNTIVLYATDESGNTSTTNTLILYASDDMPSIAITYPTSGMVTNSSSILVSGTASVSSGSITTVQVSLDGNTWLTATGTNAWSYSLGCSEGSNTIQARAISSTSKTNQTQITIIVDTQRPNAWFSSPTNGMTLSNTTMMIATGGASDSGTGIAGTYLKIDSENFLLVGTSSFTYTISNLSTGSHTLAVYTRDNAGNISLTNSITFTIALPQTNTNTNTNIITNGYIEYTNPNYNGDGYDIMLQGFHWASTNGSWWNTLATKASEIASAGFTMVWIPPISDCGDNNGYLPREWYNLSSKYGTGSQLSNAVTSLKNTGLKVIADIVINHRVGTYNWADFSNPAFPNNQAAVCSDDEWGQGTGSPDTGSNYNAGRDLDHTNPDVRSTIIAWMRWLRQIGFDGWRYDYVKGYSSSYNSNYNEATSPYFSVGELWPDISGDYYASGADVNYHRQALMNWIDASGGRSTAFDFTTKWQLMLAVDRTEYWRLRDPDGKPIGAIGWWAAMSVTFVDNHDTGYSPGGGQGHWAFPQDKREIGYAYILTHPGIPSVYWYDYFDSGAYLKNVISNLIVIRKNQGIHATSPITILKAETTEYVALINSNTIVKLGPGMTFNTNWTLAASGTNWAVWTK